MGPPGKLELFQRTDIMQGILTECYGLTVYVPSNFTPHVMMILGGRDSGRGSGQEGMSCRAEGREKRAV